MMYFGGEGYQSSVRNGTALLKNCCWVKAMIQIMHRDHDMIIIVVFEVL